MSLHDRVFFSWVFGIPKAISVAATWINRPMYIASHTSLSIR